VSLDDGILSDRSRPRSSVLAQPSGRDRISCCTPPVKGGRSELRVLTPKGDAADARPSSGPGNCQHVPSPLKRGGLGPSSRAAQTVGTAGVRRDNGTVLIGPLSHGVRDQSRERPQTTTPRARVSAAALCRQGARSKGWVVKDDFDHDCRVGGCRHPVLTASCSDEHDHGFSIPAQCLERHKVSPQIFTRTRGFRSLSHCVLDALQYMRRIIESSL